MSKSATISLPSHTLTQVCACPPISKSEPIYKYLFSLSHCSTSFESLSNQPIFALTAS